MNKTQLIQKLADDSGLSKVEVKKVLEVLTATAIDTLKTEAKFTLPDIATLKLVTKAASPEREGINPFTKAKITIAAKPESKKVKAAPVSAFKKAFEA